MSEYWTNDNRNHRGEPMIRVTDARLLALHAIDVKPQNDKEEDFLTFAMANVDEGSINEIMPKTIGETAALLALLGIIPTSRLWHDVTKAYRSEDTIHLRPWAIMKHAQLMLIQYRRVMRG